MIGSWDTFRGNKSTPTKMQPQESPELRKNLLFYKFYHHNAVNVGIHSLFVPTILISSCCILNRVELYHGITITNVFTFLYTLFYMKLYLPTGLLAGFLFLLINMALKNHWINTSLKLELALFLFGWIAQFIGHGVFERKKPAVFDNLVQSLVLAPYFILFELLFKLGFYKELTAKLETELKQLKITKIT
ncbi:hypothetical protein NCAS_0A01650 [Naumovozyma castellii]|uniref:Uncharacterized protein n=1 Tax=Naumovozyma castellii TaxID=27288 RepID=G0V5I7_NAUCA|nr:hypothetical protein NCAS_0A01650 [Naumovozyma castellii CBS 4309]CCC66723.1 hypothetical protein NCAS_0A01650 [Naumovozyma castellii CBS 4309]